MSDCNKIECCWFKACMFLQSIYGQFTLDSSRQFGDLVLLIAFERQSAREYT